MSPTFTVTRSKGTGVSPHGCRRLLPLGGRTFPLVPLNDKFTRDQKNYYGGEALALDPHGPESRLHSGGGVFGGTWAGLGMIFKVSRTRAGTGESCRLTSKWAATRPSRRRAAPCRQPVSFRHPAVRLTPKRPVAERGRRRILEQSRRVSSSPQRRRRRQRPRVRNRDARRRLRGGVRRRRVSDRRRRPDLAQNAGWPRRDRAAGGCAGRSVIRHTRTRRRQICKRSVDGHHAAQAAQAFNGLAVNPRDPAPAGRRRVLTACACSARAMAAWRGPRS